MTLRSRGGKACLFFTADERFVCFMNEKRRICYGCMNEAPEGVPCPVCGTPEDDKNPESFLQFGYILDDRYLLGKAIESNGEGVTYISFDRMTRSVVRVREFFPTGLCARAADGSVFPAEGSEETYDSCLAKFLHLWGKLYELRETPGLLPAHTIFRLNGTAYCVSEEVPSVAMREFLIKNGGTLSWEQARSLFLPIMPTFTALHGAGIIHRGISPDTLLVGKDGKLRVSGVCIAEARTADSCMTSQLFPGFAAAEQYGKAGTEGEWTDVYGLAAVIYRALVGNPPLEALERLKSDDMSIPSKIAEALPQKVLETLANALQLMPGNRIETIAELRDGLSQPLSVPPVKTESEPLAAPQKPAAKKGGNAKYVIISAAVTAVVMALAAAAIWYVINKDGNRSKKANSSSLLQTSSAVSSSAPSDSTVYYAVPSFEGLTYAQIMADSKYTDNFNVTVAYKEYSDTVARGEVISQEPVAGKEVPESTEIRIVISLGSPKIDVPNVVGKTKYEALVELMRAGFPYENIKLQDRVDETSAPDTVLSVTPSDAVSPDSIIYVDINSYKGDSSDAASSGEE